MSLPSHPIPLLGSGPIASTTAYTKPSSKVVPMGLRPSLPTTYPFLEVVPTGLCPSFPTPYPFLEVAPTGLRPSLPTQYPSWQWSPCVYHCLHQNPCRQCYLHICPLPSHPITFLGRTGFRSTCFSVHSARTLRAYLSAHMHRLPPVRETCFRHR